MSQEKDNPITVLCVDDSQDLLDLLSMAINREKDMRCVGCISHGDGLRQQVDTKKPDVLLIDLTMPEFDPLQVLREMRCGEVETKTIVFSGYDDNETVRQAMDAGACAFVSKHQEMSEILATIRKVAAA